MMMPMPWAAGRERGARGEVVVMLSRLELRSVRHVLPFLVDAVRIRRQVRRSAGNVGHGLAAEPLGKVFWTQSVWTDRGELARFAGAEPHRSIVRRAKPWMAGSTFVFTALPAADVAAGLTWAAVKERIATERIAQQAAGA